MHGKTSPCASTATSEGSGSQRHCCCSLHCTPLHTLNVAWHLLLGRAHFRADSHCPHALISSVTKAREKEIGRAQSPPAEVSWHCRADKRFALLLSKWKTEIGEATYSRLHSSSAARKIRVAEEIMPPGANKTKDGPMWRPVGRGFSYNECLDNCIQIWPPWKTGTQLLSNDTAALT